MTRRLAALVVVAALVLLVAALLPDDVERSEFPDPLELPVAVASTDAASSTWFCAAGGATTPGAVTHTVSLSNAGEQAVTARLQTPQEEGDPLVAEVEVPARSVVPVGADAFGGAQPRSVTVTAGGPISVTHRLVSEGVAEEAVCANRGASQWYFPAAYSQNGGKVTAGSALLWVYNPFPADASIDVTIVTEAGVRQPGDLTGFVVSSGQARAIELADVAQRRDQFAVAVETRAGRVVAELVQATDGTTATRGVRIQTGVSEPAMRWVFPDSEGVAGVGERLVLYNPSAEPITALVAVRPDGADTETMPDPFVLDVPGRRYVMLDLAAETRLPPTGMRTITVETDAETGLVAQRLLSVSGGDGWPLSSGAANSTGLRIEATRWIVPRIDRADAGRSILRIVNPSADSIAVVSITAIGNGEEVAPEGIGRVEVPPGATATVDVGAAAAPDVPTLLRLESELPVVVERRAFASTNTDLWVVPAIAERDTVRAVEALPQLVEPGG